jgi:hypothetical protein
VVDLHDPAIPALFPGFYVKTNRIVVEIGTFAKLYKAGGDESLPERRRLRHLPEQSTKGRTRRVCQESISPQINFGPTIRTHHKFEESWKTRRQFCVDLIQLR